MCLSIDVPIPVCHLQGVNECFETFRVESSPIFIQIDGMSEHSSLSTSRAHYVVSCFS